MGACGVIATNHVTSYRCNSSKNAIHNLNQMVIIIATTIPTITFNTTTYKYYD